MFAELEFPPGAVAVEQAEIKAARKIKHTNKKIFIDNKSSKIRA